MDRDRVNGRVRALIGQKLGLSAEDISPEATFRELGLDSMEAFQMLFLFEDEFDLEVDDETAMTIFSVPTLTDALCKIPTRE